MANISAELQAIMDAIYGEEVRGSIHDAISKINTESSSAVHRMETFIGDGQVSGVGGEIYGALNWKAGKGLWGTDGELVDVESSNYAVAKRSFPQGTIIRGRLYSADSGLYTVMSIGSQSNGMQPLVEGTGWIDFNYTVKDTVGHLWFMTNTTMDENSIYVELPAKVPAADYSLTDLKWTHNYIKDGEITESNQYVLSPVIRVPAGYVLTANAIGYSTVDVLTQTRGNGTFVKTLMCADYPKVHRICFRATDAAYVRICNRINETEAGAGNAVPFDEICPRLIPGHLFGGILGDVTDWSYGEAVYGGTGSTPEIYTPTHNVFAVGTKTFRPGTKVVGRLKSYGPETVAAVSAGDGEPQRIIAMYDGTDTLDFSYIVGESAETLYFSLDQNCAEESWIEEIPVTAAYRVPYVYTGSRVIRTDGSLADDGRYAHTNAIHLEKGETLCFKAVGSTSAALLSEWTSDYTFVQCLVPGDNYVHHQEFTADHDMYVRLCCCVRIRNSEGEMIVDVNWYKWVPEDEFLALRIYRKAEYYSGVSGSALYGKEITAIGDSLTAGNLLGAGNVWLRSLALKYDMIDTNLGINGTPIAQVDGYDSIVNRYRNIPSGSEFIVLQGGANDKNLNVPLGNLTDTVKTTFYGAVNTLIDGIRRYYPRAKLLFFSTYKRYDTTNSLGLTEQDYADALVAACRAKGQPYWDAYHFSGIDLSNEYLAAWQDEGLYMDEEKLGRNHHLSPEAYASVLPKIEQLLISG